MFDPADTSLPTLARVAGQRWTIEACFEVAKQEVGLADDEVRSWHGWYRHLTLAMLALAFLAGLRARVQRQHRPEATAAPGGALLGPCPSANPNSAASWPICGHQAGRALDLILSWSLWRRLHQALAKACHWKRQAARWPLQP